MQLRAMLRAEGVEGNEIRGGNWLGGRRGGWVLGCGQRLRIFKKRVPLPADWMSVREARELVSAGADGY